MNLFAAGDNAAKIIIVVIAAVAFVAIVAWRAYRVAKAIRTKGDSDEKQKAVGNALFGGGGAYGSGHDVGKRLGEKLGSLLKGKKKE